MHPKRCNQEIFLTFRIHYRQRSMSICILYTYVCKCKHVYVYEHFPGHDVAKSKKSRISIEMCWTQLASICCVKPHQPLLKQELCTFFKTFFGCQHFEDAMTPLSTTQFNSTSENVPLILFFFWKMRGHALERSDDVKWIATQRDGDVASEMNEL